MRVRLAKEEDFEALKRIWAFCFAEGRPTTRTWEEVTGHAEVYVAEDEGRIGAVTRNILFDMHYGEPTVPMGGLAGVGTGLADRGKGMAREMMRFAVRRMRETDRPVSMLYAFSLEFYRALGWEVCGRFHQFSQVLDDLRPGPEAARVREVAPELGPEIDGVFSRFARRYRGTVERFPQRWERLFGSDDGRKGYAFVYGGDEGPEGYVVLLQSGQPDYGQEERDDLSLREFIALTPAAYRGLLGALARLKMQYRRVEWDGPADSWTFTEPRDLGLRIRIWSQPMLRCNDAGTLLAMRAPSPSSGRYTLRIHDFEWAGGTETFEVELHDGRPEVRPHPGGGAIEMDQREFIRCWMGEPDAQALRRAGRIAVEDEEQFAAFRAHFPPAVVYPSDGF